MKCCLVDSIEQLNLSRDLRDGSRKRSGRDGGVSNTNNSNRSGKGVAKSDIVIFESLERAKERAPYLPPGGVFGIVIGGVTFILVAGAAAFQFLASLFNIDFSLTITPKDGTPSSVPSSMPSTSSPPSLAPSITNAPSLSPSSGPSR